MIAREEVRELKERVIEINRVAKVVKGGRRFSFTALVVIGDEVDRVGVGYGKAREVPLAISKAVDDAKKNLFTVPKHGTTVTHEILGRFDAARVFIRPASEGTGVIAGGGVRAVLELAGIRDVLAKSLGTTNPINMAKATVDGLKKLRRPEDVAKMRGKTIAEVLPWRAPTETPSSLRPCPAPETVEATTEVEETREHRQGDADQERDRPEPAQPRHAAGARAREDRQVERAQGVTGARRHAQKGRSPRERRERVMAEELNLHTLKPAQERKGRKRVGRGLGSGKGRYSGRGIKGQKSRAGSKKMPAGFEGGQMPLDMRAPKLRGNTSADAMPIGPFRTYSQPINLRDLDRVFADGDTVNIEAMVEKGLLKNTKADVKVLGTGDLKKKLPSPPTASPPARARRSRPPAAARLRSRSRRIRARRRARRRSRSRRSPRPRRPKPTSPSPRPSPRPPPRRGRSKCSAGSPMRGAYRSFGAACSSRR